MTSFIFMREFLFLFLLSTASFLFSAPVEKAAKYHELLLKNADSEVLMKRFLEAWLDEGDREGLEAWLIAEAEVGVDAGVDKKLGRIAQRRVLARYLDHIGAQERALEQYQEVLKLDPSDGETELAVARLQAAGLDFEGALKTLGKREDVEAVTSRGAYEHRMGNTKVALELWRGLLEKEPNARELREDLVTLFRQEGLGKEAQDLQQELIALGDDPFQRALDQLLLGDLQLEAGLKEEALLSYRRVLAASGSDSWMEREALHKLQEVFRRERDGEGLRACLAELREEMPNRLTLQKSFARQQVITGEVDEGIAAFRELLLRTPGDEKQREEFVELLDFAERYDEAAKELEVLITQEATPERWLRLAELREKSEEAELVLAALAELEKLKRGEAGGVLELSRNYRRFDLDDEALRVLKAGCDEHADSRELAEALAGLLVELKRVDEALTIWRGLVQKGGFEEVLKVAQSQQRCGLLKEAFALLAEHRQEFEEEFGGLRLYCELALVTGEVEAAWTGVQQLITLSEVFSDLQVAVNLGSAIARKKGLEETLDELAKVEDDHALCLLATLHQLTGQEEKADAALARAQGELARRHQIVLLTRRGDFDGAVAQLRGMVGKRATRTQRKQLLELLEMKGDFAGALLEAEQWKISAPGEVQAWRKRASLLVRLGRQSEAADELRRARNTFGRDDVELTRELARLQLPLGRHREALRLYEHLFRTAQTDEARLKFIDEMYAAASQVGLQDEMIVGFEREHAEAPRNLLPLRVLAQFYQLSHNYGAEQEALLKLYRLQPGDEGILFQLVTLAERNRDFAGARQLLADFAARTRSTGTLQRLATMQFKMGEMEAGLKILNSIEPEELTAGALESTALQLWQLGEHQLVLKFLEKNAAMVKADWRLGMMRADFLVIVGRVEEARGIWSELLAVENALGRAIPGGHHDNSFDIPQTGPLTQWQWVQLVNGVSTLDTMDWRRPNIPVLLPKNENEARWLSLARLAHTSLQADASGKSWQVFLSSLSYPWLAEVDEWYPVPGKALLLWAGSQTYQQKANQKEKEVELTPVARLQTLVLDEDSSRELFLELAREVEAENQFVAKSCYIHAAFKLPAGRKKEAELRAAADRIAKDEEEGSALASLFARLVRPQMSFTLTPGQKERVPTAEEREQLKLLEPWCRSRIARGVTEKVDWTKRGEILVALSLQRLSGDLEGFFDSLNRVMSSEFVAQSLVTQSLVAGVVKRQGSHYSRPLSGLPWRHSIISQVASRHIMYSLVNRENGRKVVAPALLAQARKEGWEFEGGEQLEQLEQFVKGIPLVEDTLLRAFLFYKVGMEKEFLAEIDTMAQGGSLEDQLDALSFRYKATQYEANEALLRALLAVRRDNLGAADLNLVDGLTLGEAQKNRALRDMEEETKIELIGVLGRYAKTPAGRAGASTLRRLYRPLGLEEPSRVSRSSGGKSRQRQSYRQLLSAENGAKGRGKQSQQERLESRFFQQLKQSFSSNRAMTGLRRLVEGESYQGLKAKALQAYQPGESQSYLKRVRYAQLCLAYDAKREARELLGSLLAERPYDSELNVLLLQTLEADERVAMLEEKVSNGELAEVISLLVSFAGRVEDEDAYFDVYERLVVLVRERGEELGPKNAQEILKAFNSLQRNSKRFGENSLRSMTSRLPKLKEGEDPQEGDWALRERQCKVLVDAYGELLRLPSVRGELLAHLEKSREALRLNSSKMESLVMDALKREPVARENAPNERESFDRLYQSSLNSQYVMKHSALRAVMDSEEFSSELVNQLVGHAFLSERQGELLEAVVEGDVQQAKSVLAEYREEYEKGLEKQPQGMNRFFPVASQTNGGLDSYPHWAGLLDALLRSQRWEKPVREMLGEAIVEFHTEEQLLRSELLRLCESGKLDEAVAALEELAATHLPAAAMHESYAELYALGAIPSELQKKITLAQSIMTSLLDVPRAWIPLLTFLESCEQAVWLSVDEKSLRSRLQKRLDVMYKTTFYDRLRTEGFGSYDGLALLGEQKLSRLGEESTWLEELFSAIKLAPTEGRTYWLKVSEDCQAQVEELTYLEAFIAMRKDYKIEEEGRQELLRKVLESEVQELSGLDEGQLRGLANLITRDFAELVVPEASEELEGLLERLRSFPMEGVVARIRGVLTREKDLEALDEDDAKGLCARLAIEGELELAAEFWVAYLKVRKSLSPDRDLGSINLYLIDRPPFKGTLDLVDSIRFVNMVRSALQETPELAKSMTYTRSVLDWSKEFEPFSSYKGEPAELVPYLDKVLQRDGLTELDKRVLGGFLIRSGSNGRSKVRLHEALSLQVKESGLAVHSPGVAETVLALSQLENAREKEADTKALEVLCGYLEDQELMADFRADLAQIIIRKVNDDDTLEALADVEPIGVALRDLLVRGEYGVTGKLSTGGVMLEYLNEHLASVPRKLQEEIYEGWSLALKEDAKKVLTQRAGTSQGRRIFELLFDFTDGGRRFPLPKALVRELSSGFVGDLDTMKKLIETGNEELLAGLLPGAEESFRTNESSYSFAMQELEKKVMPKMSPEYQLRLKCYLARMADKSEWKASLASAGNLRSDRALATAQLFAANPPEEQAVRLRVYSYLKNSPEALEVLVPLFDDDELRDDLASLAQSHKGDFCYMLRWLQAGGAASVQSFAPSVERPLRMSGIYEYEEVLSELAELLAPSLNASEKMGLTCDLAVLRDPRDLDAEEGEGVRTLEIRLKEAAQYILDNPLPEVELEEEKECIVQLMKAGLAEEQVELLMSRHLKDLGEVNEGMLSKMRKADAELLVYSLRASLAEGDAQDTMACLRILADEELEIRASSRMQLMDVILPKVTLPLMGYVTREGGDDATKEVMAELKSLGATWFQQTLSQEIKFRSVTKHAILFLNFATHCLTDDKKSYEALCADASDESVNRLEVFAIGDERRGWSHERSFMSSLATQADYFDGKKYRSDEFKPLRKLLCLKMREHSFSGLWRDADELNFIVVMSNLGLTLAELDLEGEEFAAARGNIHMVASAILADDDVLLLALLPKKGETYFLGFEGVSSPDQREELVWRRADEFLRNLQRKWSNQSWAEDLAVIEDDFQRLHLEFYLRSLLIPRVMGGADYDYKRLEPSREEEVFALLPEAGPSREQVLTSLAGSLRSKSKLALALVEQAAGEGFALTEAATSRYSSEEKDLFNTFLFGWVYALHVGDWSVLDFQFQSKSDEVVQAWLIQCAGLQALHQVAGDASTCGKVLERLAGYGFEDSEMNPNGKAWLELVGLVGGKKTSSWKEGWQALGVDEQKLSQAEMAAALKRVLGELDRVSLPSHFVRNQSFRSDQNKIWMAASSREQGARVLTAVMDDEVGLFAAAGVAPEERVELMLGAFDWNVLRASIERYFEGKEEVDLLLQLVQKTARTMGGHADFKAFMEGTAERCIPSSLEGTKLWLAVAKNRLAQEDLEGAKAARAKLNPEHLRESDLSYLEREINVLAEKLR